MKRHFLIVILLTLTGCNNNLAASSQNPVSSDGCTEKPSGNLSLDKKDVKDISLNSGTLKESGKISAGKSIGYKFEAQAGQKLNYQTKDDICLWLFSPKNTLLNSGDLPETGSYIIQVSAPKGSTTFNLDLSLGALQATQQFTPSAPSSSASAPSPNPPSPTSVNQPSSSAGISQDEAKQIIQNWLNAKSQMFGPPFNRQLVGNYTDTRGPLYRDILKPNGSIDWLSNNNSRYVYRASNVSKVWEFSTSGSQPFLKVQIYENRTLYGPNGIDYSKSGEITENFIYFFSQENGTWKIYDYQEAN